MKRLLQAAILGLVVLLLAWPAPAADKVKIAVVDMEGFQEESRTFKKVAEELRRKYEGLRENLEREREELAALEESFRKQSMMLSLDAREDKQKELEKKSRYLKYLQNEYTQQMKDAELDARRRVTKEVADVVSEIGKKRQYTLILDKGTLGLIYADEAIDITDEVIKAYDRGK